MTTENNGVQGALTANDVMDAAVANEVEAAIKLAAGAGKPNPRKTGLGRGNSKSLGQNTGVLESMTKIDFVPAVAAAQELVDEQDVPMAPAEQLTGTHVAGHIEFDLDQIEFMARAHCEFKEIAQFYRCHETTVKNRYGNDPEFRAAMDRGRFHTIEVLRRKQIEQASDGNTQMLIWLGKQILGQTEKADVDAMSRNAPIQITIEAPSKSAFTEKEVNEIDPIDVVPEYCANDGEGDGLDE